jgi:phosphoglycerol transferase MdoB-like AlkP superfamily enzyme
MRCYASGDRTEKGLVTVLSGYPAQPSSSIIVFPDKMSKLPSISKSLRTQGYKNYYFYGGDAEFASMKAYLLVQQFDYIFDRVSFKPENLTSKWGAHDEHLYNLVLEKLSAEKGPFFTTIMSLSSHEPFDVPYHNNKIVNDEWYGFKNSIEYADLCLYNFLENCKKQAWYANTVILLVADHGHDIGLKDVHYFGPEKYHIPMVITGGALHQKYRGMKYEQVVSQTIIPQLILSQMGLPIAEFNWQTGFENNNGFAQYHYNNGFGRVNNTQHALFDNDTRKCYEYRGPKADSLNFLNQAKAFQQVLIKDFLSK